MRALATTLAATLLLYNNANTPTTQQKHYNQQITPTPISNEYEKEQGLVEKILQKGRTTYKNIQQQLEYPNFIIKDNNYDGKTEEITIKGTGLTTKLLQPQHHFKEYSITIPRESMNKTLRKTADEYLQGKKEKYEVEQEIRKQLRR